MKEYTDAEGLMALPTSDLHNPTVCLGNRFFKSLTNDLSPESRGATTSGTVGYSLEFNTITLPIETPLRLASLTNTNSNPYKNNSNYHHSNNLLNNPNNNSGDLASVDSSDTYASCQTHPFLSQGDLTGELADFSCTLDDMDMDDLYFSSLDKDRITGTSTTRDTNTAKSTNDNDVKSQVKKSASGDASLHSLGAPMEEVFKTFQSFEMASRIDRGSHISLNEPSVPKHRKTRFQQSSLNKAKTSRAEFFAPKKLSHDSLSEHQVSNSNTSKKNRRASFMPTKSLASATKLINQHLFGIQHTSSKGL